MADVVLSARPPSFFRKHSRFLSFVGALIVFATYIIKEGVREDLKDLISSIATAESTFKVRADNGSIQNQLKSLLGTGWVQPSHSKTSSIGTISREIDLYVRNARNSSDDAMLYMDRTEELDRKLDSAKGRLQGISELRSKLYPLIDERNEIANYVIATRYSAADGPPPRKTTATEAQQQLDKIAGVETDTEKLEDTSDSMAQIALQDAELQRKNGELLLQRWTWASYGLYTVGWGLGLTGKLYGGGDILSGD
jgi:hypothetical protein